MFAYYLAKLGLYPWKLSLRVRLLLACLFCWKDNYSFSDIVETIASSDQVRKTQLKNARALNHRDDVLVDAVEHAPTTGLICEFGVFEGASLKVLAEAASASRQLVGFDSFNGLPTDWGNLLPKGTFKTEIPELGNLHNIDLQVGLIEKTLPSFLEQSSQIALIHIDVDLYDVTKFILQETRPFLVEDAIIVFDEYYGFPSFEDHEYKAWKEFLADNYLKAQPLSYSSSSVAFKLINIAKSLESLSEESLSA